MTTARIRSELAPTGVLRGGVNHANSAIAMKEPVTGELHGVSVDLMRELARRLEVPLVLTGYDFSGKLVEALKAGALDIGGVAGGAGSGREDALDFSPGYLQLKVTYLVPADSRVRVVADVDAEGVRVGVAKGSAFEPHLARALSKAALLTGPGRPTAFELLESHQVDVLAGLRHQLMDVCEKLPGARVLEDSFLVVEQTLAIPKGRPAGLAYLREFIEHAKASGYVARALARSGNGNVPVSPAQ